jgi:hypothetical protein
MFFSEGKSKTFEEEKAIASLEKEEALTSKVK